MGKNRAILIFVTVWLGMVFFCATTVQGLDLYVDADAPPGGNGLSWDTAFRDIQTAIDNSEPYWIECFGPETTIMVKSGTYMLTNQIEVNKTVGIYGGFPNSKANPNWDDRDWQNNETIVDGDDTVRCFRIYRMCWIDGFTITDGRGDDGGGMYIDASPTDCTGYSGEYLSPIIKNCSFQDNHAIGYMLGGKGGAMFIDRSDPKIQNCSFSYNTSANAGAVYQVLSSPKYLECIFYENDATDPGSIGGAIWGYGRHEYTMVNTRIINCLFYNNSASIGGAVGTSDVRPKIVNCTFWGNQAAALGGGIGGAYYGYNEAPLVSNSIFWGNSPDQLSINLALNATDDVISVTPVEGIIARTTIQHIHATTASQGVVTITTEQLVARIGGTCVDGVVTHRADDVEALEGADADLDRCAVAKQDTRKSDTASTVEAIEV